MVEQNQLNRIKTLLEEMTPSLITEVQAIFEQDPDLVQRYSQTLNNLVEQEVIRFRALLVGSLQFDAPHILGHELHWLEPVVTARKYNLDTVAKFIYHFRARLETDLPQEFRQQVLDCFDRATTEMTFLNVKTLSQ